MPQVVLNQVGQHVYKGDYAYHPIDLFGYCMRQIHAESLSQMSVNLLTHIDQRYGRFLEMKLHSNQIVDKNSHLRQRV
jgi:hypothetical protein